jgi:hypothetical protein
MSFPHGDPSDLGEHSALRGNLNNRAYRDSVSLVGYQRGVHVCSHRWRVAS